MAAGKAVQRQVRQRLDFMQADFCLEKFYVPNSSSRARMTILNNLDKHIATLYFSILVNYISTTQSAETDGGTQRPPSFGFAERGARGFHEDALHILTKTALSVTILTI